MKFHLLFDARGPQIPLDASVEEGPVVDSLDALRKSLLAGQELLCTVSIDDLIGLCDAAAAAWTKPSHPLAAVIRRHGLGFLPLWMRRRNLEGICRRSLRGRPEVLDRFVQLDDADPMYLRAQPRGLVVHWVAGNVPVVGLLSALQSLLCKNANLLKVSHVSAGLLPHLLQGFADIQYTNPHGRTVDGSVIAGAMAAVYVDRSDHEAACALSAAADVRIAWGGREAVESVMNLPRRLGTEDIVFGPKTSFAIIGSERLAEVEGARRAALAVARDATAFDQQGCNSPHTVFVERGGAVSPRAFAQLLGEEMARLAAQSPLPRASAAEATRVLTIRTEYDMRGEAFYSSPGMGWTVVFAEEDEGPAEPCYLRTLFVRAVDDVFGVVPHVSPDVQTVGLAVDERRHALADAVTARGAARCPEVGNMRLYETPWDGLFPMDRLVRWVSTS